VLKSARIVSTIEKCPPRRGVSWQGFRVVFILVVLICGWVVYSEFMNDFGPVPKR